MIFLQGILLTMLTWKVFANENDEVGATFITKNCSTTPAIIATTEALLNYYHHDEINDSLTSENKFTINEAILSDEITDNDDNVNLSYFKTFNKLPKDWEAVEQNRVKLEFPKISSEDNYKITTLHLDSGIFLFDFLRTFLTFIQPYDLPTDLLKDTIENRVSSSKLISQTMRMEAVLLTLIAICCLLAFVIPSTELWLSCRPKHYNDKRSRHPSVLAFLLAIFLFIMGLCLTTIITCNEVVGIGIGKIPSVVEIALQDLRHYHAGTTMQLKKCLTRSLDVASEAILVDLDNIEELLGKPVQLELSSETGVDVALDALVDIANETVDLSSRANLLLKQTENARKLGLELSRQTDVIRGDLEMALRKCPSADRAFCSILNPSGLFLALRLERIARDDRLLRLREAARQNLTEASRQARGEYLYVPHYVSRITLDARNQIRREINAMRARIFDEARSIEGSNSEISKQLDTVRNIVNYSMPYITLFENFRWFIGVGTVMCILFVWTLLLGALCCRCGSSEDRVRPTLLCGVFFSVFISITLWGSLIGALTLSSHVEVFFCRPLCDPEFHIIETILETRPFLGRKMNVPLKDLFQKCRENEAAYQAFQLGNTMKLEQITAHWTWTEFNVAMSKMRIDIKGLRILSPNVQQKLQNLLYACGINLTEYRIMIQGPILSKDLNALSDQVDTVARQLSDRTVAQDLKLVVNNMRNLIPGTIKPLMKLQDDLVYQLAGLELKLQPLQRQLNQSISHLKTIQYYIENQGEKIAQLKVKSYADRLGNYLDQWRRYVLSEMETGVARCRPLWDILEGLRFLLCQHILGPLNGFWFAIFICVLTMIGSTPTAHSLASIYRKDSFGKDPSLLQARTESPDTVIVDRTNWVTPDPPPMPEENW